MTYSHASVNLTDILDDYEKDVAAWLEQSKKQTASVQKLLKAVKGWNFRDLERLRLSARRQSELTQEQAERCNELEFDIQSYLQDSAKYIKELKSVALKSGVDLHVRDGMIYCYPFVVVVEHESKALRIGRKKIYELKPEKVAELLKKEQDKPQRAKTAQFLESLFKAYEFVRHQKKGKPYVSIPLMKLYRVLTLLPGVSKEYRPEDFARDIHFLDISDCKEISKGHRWELVASTSSREGGSEAIKFATRKGEQRLYHSIIFTPQAE